MKNYCLVILFAAAVLQPAFSSAVKFQDVAVRLAELFPDQSVGLELAKELGDSVDVEIANIGANDISSLAKSIEEKTRYNLIVNSAGFIISPKDDVSHNNTPICKRIAAFEARPDIALRDAINNIVFSDTNTILKPCFESARYMRPRSNAPEVLLLEEQIDMPNMKDVVASEILFSIAQQVGARIWLISHDYYVGVTTINGKVVEKPAIVNLDLGYVCFVKEPKRIRDLLP